MKAAPGRRLLIIAFFTNTKNRNNPHAHRQKNTSTETGGSFQHERTKKAVKHLKNATTLIAPENIILAKDPRHQRSHGG